MKQLAKIKKFLKTLNEWAKTTTFNRIEIVELLLKSSKIQIITDGWRMYLEMKQKTL